MVSPPTLPFSVPRRIGLHVIIYIQREASERKGLLGVGIEGWCHKQSINHPRVPNNAYIIFHLSLSLYIRRPFSMALQAFSSCTVRYRLPNTSLCVTSNANVICRMGTEPCSHVTRDEKQRKMNPEKRMTNVERSANPTVKKKPKFQSK
jgi:hypothetical protein